MAARPTYEEMAKRVAQLEEELSRCSRGGHGVEAEQLSVIFAMSLDMICIADLPTSTFLKVNPAFTEVLGYSEAELLARPFLEFIHPDDIEVTRKAVNALFQKGEKLINFKNRYRHKAGGYRWLNWVSHPQPDKGISVAVAHDITEQIGAERQREALTEELKNTSGLLNAVLDSIPDVIGVQDRTHRVIRYNKAGYDFLGCKPSEVNGRKCHELIGRMLPCEECAPSEVFRTNRVARVEKFVPEIGRWLDIRAYPILDEKGEWTQVIEHLRDITKEKTAEAELKAAHERLTTILDSIEAHIYVADIATHRILFINRQMREDFKRDLVGDLCYEAFRCETEPCAHCSNDRLIGADGEPAGIHSWEGQNPVTGRWYLNCDRAIRWVDGRLVRLQIGTDITRAKESEQERARMEAQLQQSQKFEAVGTLAGGVAHDFNNLLMGIQGRASLMLTDLAPAHPHREHLFAIEEHIRSAAELTKQLLGFARGGKYEVRPLDLNELVSSSAAMFGRTKKEIRIHTKLPQFPLVVEADRSQIEQVLLNIYVNAWQAMPDGGQLYIEAKTLVLDAASCHPHQTTPGRYHSVSIADTGIGMDAATQLRIFDPFFTTKEKGRGTGLGLASAYGIIKNHGGMITVESQKGQGAAFSVYLPASDRDVLPEAFPEGSLLKGKETILLVDDEEMIREVGRAMLERLGYSVHTAPGGVEALDALKRHGDGIDIAILDLIMPGMDGGKLFDRIREIRPRLPVILSSGYAIDGQAEEILRRGCNGFIQKPFGISELSRKLRSVLDQ